MKLTTLLCGFSSIVSYGQITEKAVMRTTPTIVDLDVDSDNNNEFRDPSRVTSEDKIEDMSNDPEKPGKFIEVNNGDADNDGVPNFSDGFDKCDNSGSLDGGQFIPLILELKEPIDLSTAKIKFVYSDSDPNAGDCTGSGSDADPYRSMPVGGNLRIWRLDGSENRKKAEVGSADGGDFIKSESEYKLDDLDALAYGRRFKLFIEGVKESAEIADQRISIHLDYDGDGPGKFLENADAVRLTCISVDVDIDSDNNDNPATTMTEHPIPLSDNEAEDIIEDIDPNRGSAPKLPGKIIMVNDRNINSDDEDPYNQIPNFADGFDKNYGSGSVAGVNKSSHFVPIKILFPESLELEKLRFKINYDLSNPDEVTRTGDGTEEDPYVYAPADNGHLRIWKENGSKSRRKADIKSDGDLVNPEVIYQVSDFKEPPSREIDLFVEAVKVGENLADQRIKIELDPNDETKKPEFDFSDAIRVTSLELGLAVDKNRDGEISFDDPEDNATQEDPYEFWINNDIDSGDDDAAEDKDPNDPASGDKDYADNVIASIRDLEDFSRLDLNVSSIIDLLKSGEFQLGLKFRNVVGDGEPLIKIWRNLSTLQFGDDRYLTSRFDALRYKDLSPVGEISKDDLFLIPVDFWDRLFINGIAHFLFEGGGVGKGELYLELHTNGNKVLESAGVYLDLKDIKNMYERYETQISGLGSFSSLTYGQINQITPDQIQTTHKRVGTFEYGPNETSDDESYILFVHGWRMKPYEKEYFAETGFKRLFWQGYKGRYGAFFWPTEWTDRFDIWFTDLDPPIETQNYTRSERKARVSAQALHHLIENELNNNYASNVSVYAHSMGNVVVSEALRYHRLQAGSKLFSFYIASQAAEAAHAYDPDATDIESIPTLFTDTPEVYADYPPTDSHYYDGIKDTVKRIFNFHNQEDAALSGWETGQDLKPDFGWIYDNQRWGQGYFIPNPLPIGSNIPVFVNELFFPVDTFEIYAHIAEARSHALGAAVRDDETVGGEIYDGFDLNRGFSLSSQNFTDSSEDHSAQFLSTNMDRNEYWKQLLLFMQLYPEDSDAN